MFLNNRIIGYEPDYWTPLKKKRVKNEDEWKCLTWLQCYYLPEGGRSVHFGL